MRWCVLLVRTRNCGCTNGSPGGRRSACRLLSWCGLWATLFRTCARCGVCVCGGKREEGSHPVAHSVGHPVFLCSLWFRLDMESAGNGSLRRCEPDRSVPGSAGSVSERKVEPYVFSRAQRLESVLPSTDVEKVVSRAPHERGKNFGEGWRTTAEKDLKRIVDEAVRCLKCQAVVPPWRAEITLMREESHGHRGLFSRWLRSFPVCLLLGVALLFMVRVGTVKQEEICRFEPCVARTTSHMLASRSRA